MRLRVLIAVAAAAGVAGCGHDSAKPPPGPSVLLGPDRIAYDLALRHRPGRLDGEQWITFRNPFAVPLRHVWLRTWANAYGSCEKPHIELRALDGARIGARRRTCTAQRVDLPSPVAPGRNGRVHVRLAVTVPRRFDRFGSIDGVDYLGNALPVLAVSDGGAEPVLPAYTFRGESFFTLAADWHVSLEMAPGERVAATGTEPQPGELMAGGERDFMLVIGPMREIRTRAGDVRVRWWARDRPSRRGLRLAARSIAALQRDLGPYGAAEFDGVQTPARIARGGIAMEYPQLILSPASGAGITHEAAHQWFYRLVGNDQFNDPWVDETLTEFAAVRLGRRLHGPDRLRGCARRHRTPRPSAAVDADMGTLERADRRRAHTIRDTLYIEGPCALFELQRRIGRDRMTAFLRDLVERHRRGILSGRELARAIRGLPGGAGALSAMRIR
jgi:hypothetical protein